MSRSKNNGRYKIRPKKKPASRREGRLLTLRNTYGGTERILKRSRKLWNRLINKERRSLDKEAIEDSLELEGLNEEIDAFFCKKCSEHMDHCDCYK
jgi:hypothetical protein